MIRLLKTDDPNSGVSKTEIRSRRSRLSFDTTKRDIISHKVLVDGPAWEMSTAEMVMKFSKKVSKPKRIGAKAANATEFESKGEI